MKILHVTISLLLCAGNFIFIREQIKLKSCLDNWPKKFAPKRLNKYRKTQEISFQLLMPKRMMYQIDVLYLNIHDLSLLKGDKIP